MILLVWSTLVKSLVLSLILVSSLSLYLFTIAYECSYKFATVKFVFYYIVLYM